jgi:hypothetical protein
MLRLIRNPLLALACVLLGAVPARAATLDADEQAFVTLINNYRQQSGRVPLKISDKLQTAAEWMSGDMGAKGYFSHTDSLGRDPFQRMTAFGYTYSTTKGENIAAGNSTAADTFTQWKNSSGHNANMLNANYRVMGIGRAYVAGSPYRYYWTNDFGGYDDSGSTADTTPPSVSISAPAEGAAVSGRIRIGVTATDNVAVRQVSFAFDGGPRTFDGSAPYEYYLDTTTLAPGAHSVEVTAWDTAGNTARVQRGFTVSNDATPPMLSIANPPDGATVGGAGYLPIRVTAMDNVGVRKVVFQVDGGALITDGNAPWELWLNLATLAAGSHTVSATAYDAAGNSTRATVTFTVVR